MVVTTLDDRAQHKVVLHIIRTCDPMWINCHSPQQVVAMAIAAIVTSSHGCSLDKCFASYYIWLLMYWMTILAIRLYADCTQLELNYVNAKKMADN